MKFNPVSTRLFSQVAIACAVAFSFSPTAKAAIQLDFIYNPLADTTTAFYSGTWDVGSAGGYSGVPASAATSSWAFVSIFDGTEFQTFGIGDYGVSNNGAFAWDGTVLDPWYNYDSQPAPHGTRIFGDPLGFTATEVYGPGGFTAQTMITGAMEYSAGVDLADLGFDAMEIANGGSYSGPGGTVNWTASVASVPEPATYVQLIGVVSLVAALIRRRRIV